MTLKAMFVAAALVGVSATPGHAFLFLLGAAQSAPEPKNEAKRVGPLRTVEEMARVPAPPLVFKLPIPQGQSTMLAQAAPQPAQTREVPYWRVELHPRNAGAQLTDPARVVYASPGRMTGGFQVQIPQNPADETPTWVYRLSGNFRVTEQGNYSFAVNYLCSWWCRIRMTIGGQEVINLPNVGGAGDRTQRFATALAPADYPIEVEWGFNNPRQVYVNVRDVTFLNVLARGPDDDSLEPIKIFNKVAPNRAAVPVQLN